MCLKPITMKDKRTGELQTVPCGKCPQCYARRISGWSFRLLQEERVSTSAHFLTLTYDTNFVPITRNGFLELRRRDVQLFFKRLRKAHGVYYRNLQKSHRSRALKACTIKYYAAGEYGGRTQRPHYHVILFNARIELVQDAWKNGKIHYGKVSAQSVGYTLKYMSKPRKIPYHRNDDRTPEFALMSKGLGKSYINEKTIAYHLRDMYNRMCVNYDGNKKCAMPRYYKDKIYTREQRSEIVGHMRGEIEKKALEEVQKNINNPGFVRAKRQAVEAAFRAMAHKAKTRTKV